MGKQKIIIVGAGISGLVIASKLSMQFNVVVLEATDHIGGRIFSVNDNDFDGVIEYGPEFIHGHAKHTLQLLKEAGIEYAALSGSMYSKEDGVLKKEGSFMEGWDELMDKMAEVKDETNLYDFLEQHFKDDVELRQQAERYAEGFDLADVKKVTVRSLYNEWAADEDETYRLLGGYGELVAYLQNQCEQQGAKFITNAIVKKVDWQKGSVKVYSDDGTVYEGAKIVITIPVGTLQDKTAKGAIQFSPALDNYIDAAQHMGWGNVLKALLAFDAPFWNDDMGFVFSEGKFPTWWPVLPVGRPVITGWIGGRNAKVLSVHTDEELLQIALETLADTFDIPADTLRSRLKAWKIVNWQNNELVRGGYSYDIAGSSAAKQLLKTAVEDTVYFSGEALYEGKHPGTVEAAIISGKETAGNVLGGAVS